MYPFKVDRRQVGTYYHTLAVLKPAKGRITRLPLPFFYFVGCKSVVTSGIIAYREIFTPGWQLVLFCWLWASPLRYAVALLKIPFLVFEWEVIKDALEAYSMKSYDGGGSGRVGNQIIACMQTRTVYIDAYIYTSVCTNALKQHRRRNVTAPLLKSYPHVHALWRRPNWKYTIQ